MNNILEYEKLKLALTEETIISNILFPHSRTQSKKTEDAEIELDKFVYNLINNSNGLYTKDFVIWLCNEVMELGMRVRQDQLNGVCGKSGNEHLKEFLGDNL